ncbi:family 65 glycoside hydrolase [Gymnopus androsaceus JB14]|uniref:alpha,alpha-trehalase n=1 Tax=Gymnopus androsaceus JB14 TaxID=1447944 RepID=A0A6A4I268_9AGAR|nr:family 65 glycoside hydrolase [Gymnopus androsaceus JB14]
MPRMRYFAATVAIGAALANATSFTLSTTNFNRTSFSVQPYVANGYIGQRIPVEGFGYSEITPINATAGDGTSGWPLFDTRFTAALVAGFYDQQVNTTGTNFAQTGGEQPISTLPTWSSLYFSVGGATYAPGVPSDQVTNWTQSLSIQDGRVETSLNWTPSTATNPSYSLRYTLFAHRTLPNVGVVRLDVDGLIEGTPISITDVLDGAGSWRTTFVDSGVLEDTIWTAVQPNGISNVTAYTTSVFSFSPTSSNLNLSSSCFSDISTNASTISQCYSTSAPSSGRISAIKYVGIASSDAFPGTEFTTALHAARHAKATGYDALLKSHTSAWDNLWQESDIIIPENEELQLAARASLFHILSNVREGSEPTGLGDNSIAPAGLTSDSYAGQIFWDADTWMFPGLLALFPSYAQSITNFRFRQLGAAEENAQEFNRSGALYPWTGARFGNCTGVGPCFDYEYHLNNDLSLAQFQYYASTQNRTWLEVSGWPVISSVASFWASQVLYNGTSDSYNTLNETDPDEFANFVNDAAYTNAGISVILKNAVALAEVLGVVVPSNWTDIANKITVLSDPSSGIILEYDGFNGSTSVKQADVVLLTYPLEYYETPTQASEDLDFYALATSPSGPGMTYSIFSIDASQLSTTGCAAYTYLLAASQPYFRIPFYQFSEQTSDIFATNGGTNPAFTFLTGHGGFLQSFTHGFTGYRSRTTSLYLDPSLPPQLTNYTIKGLKWAESTFDITLSSNQTVILRRAGNSTTATVEIATANAMSGNYTLGVGDSLTVPTRRTNGTLVEGNIAQCATVISGDTGFNVSEPTIVAGQYSLAAVDGSNATTWQPNTNASSTMTVDLSTQKTITGLHFNWGLNPPISYVVAAGPSIANMTTIAAGNVSVSAPYSVATANEVAIKVGNLTDVTLQSSISARFLNLMITGSFLADGEGGTVAEFAIV